MIYVADMRTYLSRGAVCYRANPHVKRFVCRGVFASSFLATGAVKRESVKQKNSLLVELAELKAPLDNKCS